MFFFRCSEFPECTEILQYNGINDGIFCFSKETTFTYELLRQYLRLFSLGDTPMYKYHMLISLNYSDYADQQTKFISYSTWKASCYMYMKSLEIDYEAGFQCLECKERPSVVIIDGTSLGHRKDLMTGQSDLAASTNNLSVVEQTRFVLMNACF